MDLALPESILLAKRAVDASPVVFGERLGGRSGIIKLDLAWRKGW